MTRKEEVQKAAKEKYPYAHKVVHEIFEEAVEWADKNPHIDISDSELDKMIESMMKENK
jgi:hypothetical protein